MKEYCLSLYFTFSVYSLKKLWKTKKKSSAAILIVEYFTGKKLKELLEEEEEIVIFITYLYLFTLKYENVLFAKYMALYEFFLTFNKF